MKEDKKPWSRLHFINSSNNLDSLDKFGVSSKTSKFGQILKIYTRIVSRALQKRVKNLLYEVE